MAGITDPTEGFFKDGNWGWDGTQWRKQPLVWGFSDVYAEDEYFQATGAGTVTLIASTVPAGEVWFIYGVTTYHESAGCSGIYTLGRVGGAPFYVTVTMSPTNFYTYVHDLRVVMKADDYMSVEFYGLALNDKVWAYLWGYKMKVAE